jgi:hypothetical protein
MAINRIEVAIDCDDPMSEGIEILAAITAVLELDPTRDVSVGVGPAENGTPILIAVLMKRDEGDHDNDAGL